MSEKKGKVVHVDKLIIHAKSVEFVDSENVKINRGRNIETTEEERIPRRDPWGFFWGPQLREEEDEE